MINIYDILNASLSLFKTFSFTDFLDVAIVAFLVYGFIKLTRDTRAEQLIKGIFILIFVYLIAYQLNLRMLSALLNHVFQFSVLALVVVFQPELRKALEQLGKSKFGGYWSFNSNVNNRETYISLQQKAIDCVVNSALVFQEEKVGALIIFEREIKLGEVIDTGTMLNASPSVPLIGNIFFNKAPLHDGAMIIRDGMIFAAGCILPLTQNEDISIELGTRHRAALGISEISDAVIVIVSEETGSVSLAVNGSLTRNLSNEELKTKLEALIIPDISDTTTYRQIVPIFRKFKKARRKK